MKKRILRTATVLLIIIGILALVYPSLSNLISDIHATQVINEYNSSIQTMDKDKLNSQKQKAKQYNKGLSETVVKDDKDSLKKPVSSFNDGEMEGYITIPKINAALPIYEGTKEGVLSKGVGHVKGTSLPCGGESTHCAIAGHSGLANAEMFSRLEELSIGDTFSIKFLDSDLEYKVDDIQILKPKDADGYVKIVNNEDYCTLITCTPITVNTHRLLVRGKRVVEEAKANTRHISKAEDVLGDKQNKNWFIVFVFVSVPVLFCVVLFIILFRRRRKRNA